MNEKNKLFLNFKNIVCLIRMYQFENCLKLNIEHHVSAIIKKKNLQKNFKISNVDFAKLFTREISSKFEFSKNVNLICLHKQHRFETIKKFLLFDDK